MTHDDQCEGADCRCAVREIGWVAKEARALIGADPARRDAFTARKRALLDYINGRA